MSDKLAKYGGGEMHVLLPLTREGAIRMDRLKKWTGYASAGSVILQAVIHHLAFVTLIPPGRELVAVLGNHLHRFDKSCTVRDDMLSQEGGAARITSVRFTAPTADLLRCLCAAANCIPIEALRRALLFYEWYVERTMTGHEIRMCTLGNAFVIRPA